MKETLFDIYSIMTPTYTVGVFIVLLLFWWVDKNVRRKRIILLVSGVCLLFFAWRAAAGVGSKRYGSIFIFVPVFLLGMLTVQPENRTLKWLARAGLAILLVIAGTKVFICYNRYSRYTINAAHEIRADLKKRPGARAKIVSFMNKGTRIGFWSDIETEIIQEDHEEPSLDALRLSLNYWKYSADVIYVILRYPVNKTPPAPCDMLLRSEEWKKIYESFVDNRKTKKAYVFRYQPVRYDEAAFESVIQLENGDFEKVVSDIGFARKLMPLNPEYYSREGARVFPPDWNLLFPGHFEQGAAPEISCIPNALSGKYSLHLASEKSIFIYNSHAVDIAGGVFLAFDAAASKESLLHVWLITAERRDQVNGCIYKRIAVIPFSQEDVEKGKRRFFLRLEPSANGKNRWARIAVELEHGEVKLDNFQLVRKKETITP